MLTLIDAVAESARTHGGRAYIKCHASTGQTCPGYPDPISGGPINFNFLPHFSQPSMGLLPHTVQAYALDDPTAGTYGNADWSAMSAWLRWELDHGDPSREVVYHPESNYWVNVDVDVPLFLPLYGERRLRDIRHLLTGHSSAAPAASARARRIDGTLLFDSGWEWGAWLSDVVAARAAWDPLLGPKSPSADVFAAAVTPIGVSLLGPSLGPQFAEKVAELAIAQHRLLILGGASSPVRADLARLSGFGYLSGRSAWTDLLQLVGVAATQARLPSCFRGIPAHHHAR